MALLVKCHYVDSHCVLQAGIPETRAAQRALVPFARLLPPFNLGTCELVQVESCALQLQCWQFAMVESCCNAGEGLIELSKYNLESGLAEARAAAAAAASSGAAAALPAPPQSGVFAYHVLGRSLLHLAAEAAAFFALVLLLERLSTDGDPWAALADRGRGWLRRLTGRGNSGKTSEAAAAAAKSVLGGDLELTGLTNGHADAALQTRHNGHAQVSMVGQFQAVPCVAMLSQSPCAAAPNCLLRSSVALLSTLCDFDRRRRTVELQRSVSGCSAATRSRTLCAWPSCKSATGRPARRCQPLLSHGDVS